MAITAQAAKAEAAKVFMAPKLLRKQISFLYTTST
jgi:hypothetical protein